MFPRMLRRLLIAVALLSLAPACGDKQNLQKINAPAAGVTLSYDFTPGQVYTRPRHPERDRPRHRRRLAQPRLHLRRRPRRPRPRADGNGTLVTARYSAIDIRWGLPPGFPISVAEVVEKAKEQLQGLEVDFSVDEAGKIRQDARAPRGHGAPSCASSSRRPSTPSRPPSCRSPRARSSPATRGRTRRRAAARASSAATSRPRPPPRSRASTTTATTTSRSCRSARPRPRS
jgi:hypothetical protein